MSAPTLQLCALCGNTALVGSGIDEAGHVRWLCGEHFEAHLEAMLARLESTDRHPSRGRR